MAREPSDEAIDGLIGLSGLPRSNAIRWLKAHNNDPNNAAMAWIDGGMASLPPPPKYNESYNEGQFHTDRDGNPPQSQLEASFGTGHNNSVDPDALNSTTFSEQVPPTRPSSRVSSTRLAPVYGPDNNPSMPQEESFEQQILRAKEMSLGEGQTLPAQETGITYTNPNFHPANGDYYDSAQWALTVANSTQENFLTPEPPDRKRQPWAPAFLRPSFSGDRLPALLKILHAVPLAREALLNRAQLSNDYGRGSDWWNGTPIRGLRVVNVDEDNHHSLYNDMIYETQRLMAFLDDTERAYGSADAWAEIYNKLDARNGRQASFLECWRNAAQCTTTDDASLSTIFGSRGIRRAKGGDQANEEEQFTCLDVKVDETTADKGCSLYEAIDDFVWTPQSDSDIYLDQVGEVLTFEVENQLEHSQSLGISIPPIWYADRYLESTLKDAADIQAQKARIMTMSQEIDAIQAQMTSYQKPGSRTSMDVGPLMNKVTDYLRQTAERRDSVSGVEAQTSDAPSESLRPVIEQLSMLAKRVAERLKKFQDDRETIYQRMMKASEKYKAPSDDPNSSPTHKYLLTGVISVTDSFYVLEKAPEADEDEDLLSQSVPGHQWWRLEYDRSSANPVQPLRVTEDEVLKAASTDGKKVLLVYASEKALQYQIEPLPRQLQNFVYADNMAFREEFNNFLAQYPPSGFTSSFSPSKRKANTPPDSDSNIDSDMEVETGENDDLGSSNSSPLDPNPGGIVDDDYVLNGRHDLAPLRPLAPKPPIGSSDEVIPIGLQQEDQEMKESGPGLLQQSYLGKHKHGTFTPEINMNVDDKEDEDEKEANV